VGGQPRFGVRQHEGARGVNARSGAATAQRVVARASGGGEGGVDGGGDHSAVDGPELQ